MFFQRRSNAGTQPAAALVLVLITTFANAYHETDDDEAARPGNAAFPLDGCNCAALANGNMNGTSLPKNGSGNFSGGFDGIEIQAFDANMTANGTMNGTCAPKQELSECQQEDADKQASYDGRCCSNIYPKNRCWYFLQQGNRCRSRQHVDCSFYI